MGLVASLTAWSAGTLVGILAGVRLLLKATLQLRFAHISTLPPRPLCHLLPLVVLGDPGLIQTRAIQSYLRSLCLAAGPGGYSSSYGCVSCLQLHSSAMQDMDGRDWMTETCMVQIWEIGDPEERLAAGKRFFASAAGFLLLYEVSGADAHQRLETILTELRGYLEGTEASKPIAAVGISKTRKANPYSRASRKPVSAESPRPDSPTAESSADNPAAESFAKQMCAREAIPLFVMSDADDTVAIKKAFRHVAVSAAHQL